MDRVATISGGDVFGSDGDDGGGRSAEPLSEGWRRQDGAFSTFWLISPEGRRWQVKTQFLSTNILELVNAEAEGTYLLFREGRGIRTVFAASRPGYELARIIWEGGVGVGTFGVYAVGADFRDGITDWLIAAALAVAAVDGRRSVRA